MVVQVAGFYINYPSKALREVDNRIVTIDNLEFKVVVYLVLSFCAG